MKGANMIYWKEPKDRSVADDVRVEVLEMLIKLKWGDFEGEDQI
jgi:hypothetical protein